MDVEVKQRNRRRRRAQRMQAQRDSNNKQAGACAGADAGDQHGADSGDDEEDVLPAKPPRPPNRRKKSKEPLCEEDIIDGFAILQFRTYEDLELVLKISTKENIKRLTEIERPKIEPKAHITNHILVQHNHGLTLSHDPATSDDSGRASERLTGSSVAPRDADSSRDRLSDASSRCSSGKGYICDSEGEDDKGSDASSVIFASTPASRKHEFPGALPPHHHHHHHHGTGGSPVPAPTPPNLPVPSPAPAQQPPQHPPQAIPSAAVSSTTPTQATTPGPTPPAPQQPVVATGIKSTQDNLPPPPAPTTASTPHQPPLPVPSVPTAAATMPQPAAAPIAHHHQPVAAAAHHHHHHHAAHRTESPAVATSANAAVAPSTAHYHHPQYQQHQQHQHQPLYAPYAAVTSAMAPYTTAGGAAAAPTTPYTTAAPPAAIPTSAAAAAPPAQQPAVKAAPSHLHGDREKHHVPPSPRGPSPVRESRERESYSNVSSLSRSSVSTTLSCPPPPITTTVSSSLAVGKSSWGGAASSSATSSTATSSVVSRHSPAPPRPTFQSANSATAPSGGTQQPMFAAPLPPPISRASPITPSSTASAATTVVPPQPNPNPFSAESLFQSSKYQSSPTDMLRRELDSRFLASQDRSLGVAPPPYLRTEMHQHQHHHTHVHQHTTSLLPPTAASTLYPSPLFKDIPKLGSVDSPFYRQNLGLPSTYPGYTPGLLHPGLTTGPTPFVPPNHLTTFQPKKTGKWNAMHVRVAWEIYHHQQKSGEAKGNITAAKTTSDLLRPPTHLFSPSVHSQRQPHEMATFPPSLSSHRPPGFDQPHPGSLFTAPGHLGKSPFATGASMSPFTRYGGGPLGASGASPYSMSPFATRDGHLGLGALHHDPWRSLPRTIPTFPPSVNPLPPTLPGLTQPGPTPWTLKPDPILEQREREAREREERERERLRREREERERREREEKQRRIEQQQQQEQRERERREREKREMERRELERQRERERERERLLQEQRLVESAKQLQAPLMRDRSPLRNGDLSEIRVKEEPRVKEEDLLARADHRYNPFLRHPGSLPPPPGPGSVLDRSRMLPPHALPPHHYAAPHWGAPPPPTDPFYRYSYNPLVVDAMRAQEERANFFGAYGPPPHHQLRPKDPQLMHLRAGPGPGPPPQQQQQQQQPPSAHKISVTPPTDLHKKEEPR